MNKFLLLLFSLISASTFANYPPTTSKIVGDTAKKTTFDFDFPVFSGAHTGNKVSITGATNLPVSGDISLTNAKYSTTLVGKSLAELSSTGLLSGAVTAVNANPALFDFGPGTGEVIDYATDPANPTIKPVSWSSFTGVSVTNIASADKTYVSVDSTGALFQQITFPTQAERRARIFAAVVVHPNRTTIQNITTLPDFTQGIGSQVYDFLDALGAFNVSGNKISANGANLSLNKTLGQIFRRSTNYSVDDQNPHVTTQASATPKSLIKATQSAQVGSSVTVIDPLNYDVGGTVTLVPGGGSTSTVQRVYMFSSGLMFVQYGQTTYTNLSNAIAAIGQENFIVNPSIADGGVLLAYIAVQKNCTALNASCSTILAAARFDAGVGGGALSTTTLQGAYNNSTTPQIITDATRGSVDFQRGSASDANNVFRILNGAGSSTASITGAGALSLSTALTIANGGTGQITKDAAFNALSPMTTAGDLIIGGASGTGTRLASGSTSGHVLTSNGSGVAPSWKVIPAFSVPTIQKFTTGSGTYTTPVGVKYLKVRMVGGGGGAGGSGSASAGTGGTGGTTTFGTSLLTCTGGIGGQALVGIGGYGGPGGTATLNAPAIGSAFKGGGGGGAGGINTAPGKGGDSIFGGGARSGSANSGAGTDGETNTGGGASGAEGNFSTAYAGAGGGAGAGIEAIITSPSASYSYNVGAGGAKGTAGTSGTAGGLGGSGYIEVTEYY